jgi:hypothetical protein
MTGNFRHNDSFISLPRKSQLSMHPTSTKECVLRGPYKTSDKPSASVPGKQWTPYSVTSSGCLVSRPTQCAPGQQMNTARSETVPKENRFIMPHLWYRGPYLVLPATLVCKARCSTHGELCSAYFSKMKVGLSNHQTACLPVYLCPQLITCNALGRFSWNLVRR